MITFFFLPDVTTPGGVQSLIINIATNLNKRKIKFKLIDTTNGIIYNELIKRKIDFDFYDFYDKKTRYSIDKNDVLISFGQFNRDYKYFKNKRIKILYWSLFPTELIDLFSIKTSINNNKYSNKNIISKYYTIKLVELLSEKKALNFMESSHVDVLLNYNKSLCNLDYRLIPIPIEMGKIVQRNISDNEVNIAYIGRKSDWKILPFCHLINDITNLDYGKKVNVYLFSNDCNEFIKCLTNANIAYREKISIIEHNNFSVNSIKHILSEKVDILFAMGTSLLEGSSIGIPTIILDPTYTNLPINYKYRWLYEESGYSLGLPTWLIYSEKGNSLLDVFDLIYDDNMFNEISLKTYNYTLRFHSIDSVVNLFIKSCNRTELKLEDLKFFHYFLTVKSFIYYCIKIILHK